MKDNIKENLTYVVGTAFIEDGKLLISMSQRSAKKGKFTLVGGGVDDGETFIQAAKRECEEEINNSFVIDENQLEEILVFREPALSNPNVTIEMHMFLAKKKIDVELIPNEEILEFRWFSIGEDEELLSSAITDNLIPWALFNNLLY